MREGGAVECWVPVGLTLHALHGWGDLVVGLQAANGIKEGHNLKAKGLHIVGNKEGNDHGGLFLVLPGGGSGETAWDRG